MSDDPALRFFITLFFGVMIVSLAIILGIYVLLISPFVIAPLWLYVHWRDEKEEKKKRDETLGICNYILEFEKTYFAADEESIKTYAREMFKDYNIRYRELSDYNRQLADVLADVNWELFSRYSLQRLPPFHEVDFTGQAGFRWRVRTEGVRDALVDPIDRQKKFISMVGDAFYFYFDALPDSALLPPVDDAFLTLSRTSYELMPNLFETTEDVVMRFQSDDPSFKRMEAPIYTRLMRNVETMSGVPTDLIGTEHDKKIVFPKDYSGEDRAMIYGYLHDTPLLKLFDHQVQVPITRNVGLHTHIMAGTDYGKTQLLQYLLIRDLSNVEAGKMSVIVIDSQTDLINNVKMLKVFAPNSPLFEKLVLIDPTDEYVLSFNLFDINIKRIQEQSSKDQEETINGVMEMFTYFFGSLMDSEMTTKQETMFGFVVQLLLTIPDANIHTLRHLLEKKGHEKFMIYINGLKGTQKAFMINEFPTREYDATKQQVLWRLYSVLKNKTLERMFTHPRNKLDLYAEMNAGKVILISTAKGLLKEANASLLGRFFISSVVQAAQNRVLIPKENRLPVQLYIDEAADYLDDNTEVILRQLRKFHIGVTLIHQDLEQLKKVGLVNSFNTNTAYKIMGGLSHSDATAMAHDMRCESSFIFDMKKYSGGADFAVFARNQTDTAMKWNLPYSVMENAPKMTEEEWQQVISRQRSLYYVHIDEVSEIIEQEFDVDKPVSDADIVDIDFEEITDPQPPKQ